MKTKEYTYNEIGVTAQVSMFAPEGNDKDRVDEFHAMLHVEPRGELFEDQMNRIFQAEKLLMKESEILGARPVFKRFFLSDSTNQMPVLNSRKISKSYGESDYNNDYSVSIIQQPPLDGSKIAIWLYLQRGSEVRTEHGVVISEHNGYRHLYKMGLYEPSGDSYYQTKTLLEDYEDELRHFGATLEGNCIRTWFFVRDVDTQYAGMVKARKENFIAQGLTEKTHYIASTGIGGLPADPRAIVQLGTYALTGFKPEQQRYLYAPTHLNPTYEYGVTFERGTVLEFGDRAQVYISGTASINNKGEVVHVGGIVKQTLRMWDNVETLLDEGGSTWDDVMQIIVYLRDMCDYQLVSSMFNEKFPNIPRVITLAPVCRPTWLIEMECIATPSRNNTQFTKF